MKVSKERDDAVLGGRRRGLVGVVAESLRQRVFAADPGALIGALPELAQAHDVGVVTVQQAARILEHEGLLDVRRGPRGGYYGRRPDANTIENVLAAYMRMHPDSYTEVLDITSLLFTELCGAAAHCTNDGFRAELRSLSSRYSKSGPADDLGALETELQDLLFRMVERPILEMLTRVALRFATGSPVAHAHGDRDEDNRWLAGRRRIIDAICSSDEPLARFEADRSNRQLLLSHIKGGA